MSRKKETMPRDPGAMSGLLTGISFIAGVGGWVALADSPFPRPGTEPAEVSHYFTENSRSARLSATGQLVSTAALARFTASVARLAGRSGPGSESLQKTAIVGGALAVASLATSGLHTLALSGRWGKEDESAARLARRSFAFGGPIHGVGFGVLTGALSLAGLRTGELPRPVAIIGLASAASGVLSPLYFLKEQAGWLIPIGRFSGLVVSGIAGVRLSRR
ncbi:hypothetical protein Rxycam_01392 [Rubrobacter xylanophilus DSM 9941]|nr:hypothetical protein Rxycam_01392 [Rubrobacter xylanophilus DSM 9941]